MITIFKNKNDIPGDMDYIELNDVFFNQNTASRLDSMASAIIEKIDDSRLVDKYKIESKFNGVVLDIDCLSTGCKTILNVQYFPNKVFCMKECGDNALEVLYGLENGAVYSDYAVIPFDMKEVRVSDKKGKRVISDYEELKEWYNKSGLPLKRFFNTSGILYKEMQLKDKLPTMSEEEQLKLLATNGMLVKRPLVVNGDTVLIGFKEAEWAEKLN